MVASVLVLGALASYWASQSVRSTELHKSREEILQRAGSEQALIREQVSGHFEALHSLEAVFAVQRFTTLEKFKPLAQRVIDKHPSLLCVQWVPSVNHGERTIFEQHAAKTFAPDYRIRSPEPLADTGVYYPSYYAIGPGASLVEPGSDLQRSPLAGDLKRARDQKRSIITARSSAAIAGRDETVLTLVTPVFAATADELQGVASGDFLGFILGTARASAVVSPVGMERDAATDLMVVDATPATPESSRVLLYRAGDASDAISTEAEFRAGWFHEVPLLAGERIWLVLHRGNAAWSASRSTALSYLVLASGGVFTLLFAFWLRSVLRAVTPSLPVPSTKPVPDRSASDPRPKVASTPAAASSQQQLAALLDNNPSGIFVKDPQGRYLSVNRQYAEMYGRTQEEFLGRSDLDLFSPEVASRLRLSDNRVLSSGKAIELEESFSLPGRNHTSIIHKFPFFGEDGEVLGLCGITIDISERKRAEAEIRESRRQLESLLGQLPGMAFRFINDGQMTPVYVSRGALGLTGHSARDFIEGVVRFTDVIHPEDRERSRNTIAAAVKKRRSFEVEYRIVDRTGRIKWVLERGQGVFDEDGKLLFIEGLAIDITQRKDAESEKLIVERRLLEGQKLESIGVLAGGIAHDFNNLLTGIIGNANLAALDLPGTSRVQQNLKQIEIASQRAAELCQQMLAYAGKGRFVVQRVDLGSLVQTTVPLLRASISKRAQLRFDLGEGIPPVLADPTQMRQIVMNLVLNASEALGDQDGEITVTTKLIRPTAEYLVGAVLSPPELGSEFVLLQVRDTGCGMNAETMAKIFDPFFTTKFAGRGLGLAAVLGIIRSHKGGLKVLSKPGIGSTFTLLFPVLPGPVETGIVRKNTAAPWRQEGLALIIDDEDHVRNVTAGMLHSCGLRTETARDGYEGLDLFRARPQAFDIVVLDMTMPRLSGEETLLLLREIRPDVRVLFMSGYNRREVVESMAADGVLSFIQKPFTLEALREHLQQMLA